MKDIPIIFSAPMVRALLDGRKTMTRRLVPYGSKWMRVLAGDRLWVRESLTPSGGYIAYAADASVIKWEGGEPRSRLWRWKQTGLPSIHMPRWASRLTLEVTATKVERVKQITEADANAEGIQHRWLKSAACAPRSHYYVEDGEREHSGGSAKDAFEMLWVHLHGTDSWEQNPEVIALSFIIHNCNIDTLPKAQAA